MKIELKSVENIRDLGGLTNDKGETIKLHKLIRSANLASLSEEDFLTLKNVYEVKTIVDFRSEYTKKRKKDLIDDSVAYFSLKTLDFLENTRFTFELYKEDYDTFFLNAYEQMATKPEAIAAYQAFFKILLAQKEGALLYHCTSGKDRTGMITVFLLTIFGFSEEEIRKEHFRTNETSNRKYQEFLDAFPDASEKKKEFMKASLIAKPIYLDKFLTTIKSNDGNVMNFIKNKIGLTEEELNELRERYLTK